MPLKKHHKYIIGSLSTLVIIYMIVSSILLFMLSVRINQLDISLDNKIEANYQELTGKTNELTNVILSMQKNQTSLTQELSELKATASSDFSGIIQDSINSVVVIATDISQGSGFFITNQGHIVTNTHVLLGAHYANIRTYDNRIYESFLVGYNEEMDIAILKIKTNYYKPLKLANSDNVNIGQKAVALGNPYGLSFTATEGIVSAKNRKGPNELPYYLQVDVPLNPGNSGGPLIDKSGKVIGINNFKIGIGESLGFALESNHAKRVINEIASVKINQTLVS